MAATEKRQALNKTYKEKFGKQPSSKWSDEEVQAKINGTSTETSICQREVKEFSTEENAESVRASYTKMGYKTRVAPRNGRFVLFTE